jgi:hypothetical protein
VAVHLDFSIPAANYPDFFCLEEGIAKKLEGQVVNLFYIFIGLLNFS